MKDDLKNRMNQTGAGAPSAPPVVTDAEAARLAKEEAAKKAALEEQKRTKVFLASVTPKPMTTKSPSDQLRDDLAEKDAKGLLCPNEACRSARSKVLNTERQLKYVIRYRECLGCGTRFKTTES